MPRNVNTFVVEIGAMKFKSVRCWALYLGMIYLPEILYRRILNAAFGPGGWALMPRGETLHSEVCPCQVYCD